MTQEEKQLLLIDLCARLPYGIKCYEADVEYTFDIIGTTTNNKEFIFSDGYERNLEQIKPYLRPLSSMTEDEKDELYDWGWDVNGDDIYSSSSTDANNVYQTYQKDLRDARWLIDWLNAHHFDHRDLIEKGLALEAPEGMYTTE